MTFSRSSLTFNDFCLVYFSFYFLFLYFTLCCSFCSFLVLILDISLCITSNHCQHIAYIFIHLMYDHIVKKKKKIQYSWFCLTLWKDYSSMNCRDECTYVIHGIVLIHFEVSQSTDIMEKIFFFRSKCVIPLAHDIMSYRQNQMIF